MRKLPKYVAMMAISMAATAALPAALLAQDRDRDRDEDRRRDRDRSDEPTEKLIRADDLPDAVRRTIEREAVGRNHFIDRRERDEKVRYIVHYTARDGKRMRIRVDDRGKLVEEPTLALEQPGPDLEREHARDDADRSVRYTSITEEELPDRVAKTMDEFREGTHDPFFRRQIRGGKTFYSVHYTTPTGERMWVRVAENGQVAEGPHINIGRDIGLRVAGGADRDDDRADRRADRDEDRDDRRADRDDDRRGERMDRRDRAVRREDLSAGDLPADVRRAIEQETAGGTEHRFVRESRGDEVTYFVEYTKNGQRANLRVDDRGRVLGETEAAGDTPRPASTEMTRTELSAADLPAEVRRTVEAETPGAIEHKFVREARGGEVTYFIEYTKDGRRGNLRVDERGKILGETDVAGSPRPGNTPQPVPQSADDEQIDAAAEAGASHAPVAANDMPAEVRAAIEQATRGGSEHLFQRHTQEGRTVYTAHYRTAEDDHNIVVVDQDGQVLVEPRKSRWLEAAKGVSFVAVNAADLPAEVRQAVEKQTAGGTEHLFVRRDRKEGEPTYLVQFTNAKGRRMQMEVNANGKVRNEVSAAQEQPFRLIGRKGERGNRRSERQ